jgi:hypothetical protein
VSAFSKSQVTLRLAPSDLDAAPRAFQRRHHDARRRAIRDENRLAAGISPDDARWALAVRTAQLIQGGRAAILTPDSRDRLLQIGRHMGLRTFDSNLIIAIVQDGARHGEPLGEPSEARLGLVRPAEVDRASKAAWWAILASIILASAFLTIAIQWLTMG